MASLISTRRGRALLAACSGLALFAGLERPASAQVTSFNITDFASLNNAIASIDQGGANAATNTKYTFSFAASSSVSLGTLNAINLASGSSLAINGNMSTLDGGGTQRGLFVFSGNVTVNGTSMLNIFCLGPKGQIFVDCGVPPGKPIWRQGGPILVGNSKARPAESVNDVGSRAVFKHGFKKKSLRSSRRQRIRQVRIRIEKDRIVPSRKAAKFVCKCQPNGH